MIDITPRPDMVYEPDLVGRITQVSYVGLTDTYKVTLAGESGVLDIGPDAVILEGSPVRSDSLLIYGIDGNRTWYAAIGIVSTGPRARCAALDNSHAWDAGGSIVFAFRGEPINAENYEFVGIRLPKADGWDENIRLESDGRIPPDLNRWCLDLRGRVSAVYPGTGA